MRKLLKIQEQEEAAGRLSDPEAAEPSQAAEVEEETPRRHSGRDPLIALLTQEQVDQCNSAFDEVDQLGDGRVPYKKLQNLVYSAGGERAQKAEIQDRLTELGLSEEESVDGCISRTDFLRLMGHRARTKRSERLVTQPTAPSSFSAAPPPQEESGKPNCCMYAIYYVVLFFAHWFGANRFDINHDGEFDPSDVEAFMEARWDFMARNFHIGNKKEKKLAKKEAVAREEEKKQLSLRRIQGRWLVGDPGSEFVVTIMENGSCLYDGRYGGPENDIIEEQTQQGRLIRRVDGWSVDLRKSNKNILVWGYPDAQELLWRRILDWRKLSLKALAGEWCVVEDGQESTDQIMVGEAGVVMYDGEQIEGQDLELFQNPDQNPELRRGEWECDFMRSSADTLRWVNPTEPTVIEWVRPQRDPQSAKSVAAGLALDALDVTDDAIKILEDILAQDVEGEALEDKQLDAMAEMFTMKQFRPRFIFMQCAAAVAFWMVLGVKICMETGDWSTFATQQAGLDTIWEGKTSLSLVGEDCTSYRFQLWRALTYQFTHVGANHVMLNSILTLILGFPLEALLGFIKMCGLFNCGVVGGALAYGIWDTKSVVVGMSGGCYALIGIHFAEIFLNWRRMKFARFKILMLLILIAIENVNHYFGGVSDESSNSPTASNSAHFGGAMAGLIMGTLIGYNDKYTRKDRILQACALALGVCLTIFCSAWIFAHEDPFPFWEWSTGNQPTYWYQQVYVRRCLGTNWRCVRCKCHDHDCLARLSQADVASTDWYRMNVDWSACPTPWYSYMLDPPEIASLDFETVPLTDPNHACYTPL